jgi:Family of unknown function (DUF6308)
MVSAPLILRGVRVDDPLTLALGFVEKYMRTGDQGPAQPMSFGERDLRSANRGGARISAVEIAAVLERRAEIERALRRIRPDASLAGPAASIPWAPLTRLFDAFAGIRGIGFSKMTKALHPKRPALIPMLDSVVQAYLADDAAPAASLSFGERAAALVRSYKCDLDHNRVALAELQRELATRGYRLTDVRLLDVLIWSVSADR